MKFLKKLLLGLVGIIAILLIIGLTQPSDVSLERSLVINAPVEMVYDQVNNLYNWEKWSPWHKIDPNMGITYTKGGIGEGASYSWTSDHKNVGNGTLTISDAKEFEYIKTLMDFGEQGDGTADFKFEQIEKGTKVSWDMHTNVGKNPFMRLMGIMIKKSIGEAYDRGLADIANQCEFLKENSWHYVKTKTKDGWKYYGITTEEVSIENMEQTMSESYGTLYAALGKAQIEVKGAPFAIYYSWGETFKMECGVSVDDHSKQVAGIDAKEMPKQHYAVIKHVGAYSGLMGAHEYMDKWLKTSTKENNGAVIEKYKVGPSVEKDSTKWITYVLYPIKDKEK